MFEEDHSESPGTKAYSVVLLAASGVVVATVFATLAALLASGGSPATRPPEHKAEAEWTAHPNASAGSTLTLVITVSSAAKPRTEQVKPPAEVATKPRVAVTPTRQTTVEPTITSLQTIPPSSSSPTSASSPASTTATTTTAVPETQLVGS